ncbi:MAG: hypothetical protein KGH71_03140 [Candidatus Micrarchaeota archaeon]|nr:hypothetical protein [Candidatus Micrarchaeota archaeon]
MDCPEEIIGGILVLDLSEEEIAVFKFANRKKGDNSKKEVAAILRDSKISKTVLGLLADTAKEKGNPIISQMLKAKARQKSKIA